MEGGGSCQTLAHRGSVLALVFIKERGLSPASLSSIGVEELSLEALHLLDELLEGEDGVHKQGGQSCCGWWVHRRS